VVGVSDDAVAGEGGEPVSERDDTGGGVRRYIDYVLLAGFLLLAGVAAVSLYLSVGQVITDWVAPEFRSLFRTAFNIVVLLVVGVGISWQLRRLR
jgi:hypothetical protein